MEEGESANLLGHTRRRGVVDNNNQVVCVSLIIAVLTTLLVVVTVVFPIPKQNGSNHIHIIQINYLPHYRKISLPSHKSVSLQEPHTQNIIKKSPGTNYEKDLAAYVSTWKQPHGRYTKTPKPHIFFLKTHKTASSTIQNILFRLGDINNLNFAVPSGRMNRFSYPSTASNPVGIRKSTIRPADDYNIVAHHMVFNPSIIPELYRGGVRPFLFTIVRDPVQLFYSSFNYFKPHCKAFQNAGTIHEFLNSPSKYCKPKDANAMFCHNHLMFDLGYSSDIQSITTINRAIMQIDSLFDLVLIQDRMSESLVLLKHALNLTDIEVVSFRTNSRAAELKADPQNEASRIKAWNKADSMLFEHFNSAFEDKVEKFGRARMRREVAKLESYEKETKKMCLDERAKPTIRKRYGTEINEFALVKELSHDHKRFCENIVRFELDYSALIFKRQYPRWEGFG